MMFSLSSRFRTDCIAFVPVIVTELDVAVLCVSSRYSALEARCRAILKSGGALPRHVAVPISNVFRLEIVVRHLTDPVTL